MQNAEALLKHSNGQYSAFDVAQYIFWTGDGAGVARAVEELIQEGVMTRENAIKFLHDIRLGIEYLENTYSKEYTKDLDLTVSNNNFNECLRIHIRFYKTKIVNEPFLISSAFPKNR